MLSKAKIALLLAALLATDQVPQYTSDAQLPLPEHYREWVYLTSGFDMSYNPSMRMGGGHVFDNVFVNPDIPRRL